MKQRKKLPIILLVIVMLCLTSCSSNKSASQDDFLKDMSKGIKSRISSDKDTSAMSELQIAEYYAELVNCELKEIGKYSDAEFPDKRFNTLAHQYINACEIQLAATENYRNSSLYDAMWSGGREVRSAIIVYFYENYDLNLSDDELASYLPSSANYSITIDSSGGDVLDLFSDKDDVKLSHGDLTIEKSEGEQTNYGYGTEFCNLKYTVKNNSAHELKGISVWCVVLDADKNILTTTTADRWVAISSGKTALCEGMFTITDYPEAKYIQIEKLCYDGDGDSVVHDYYLTDSEIEKSTLVIG